MYQYCSDLVLEKDQTENEDLPLNEKVEQEDNNLHEELDQDEQNQDHSEKSLKQEDDTQEHDGYTEDLKEIPIRESDDESLDIEENNFFYPDESESEKETEAEPENSHPVAEVSEKDSPPSNEAITSPDLEDSSSSSSDESFSEPKHEADNLHQNEITPKSPSSSSSSSDDDEEDQQEPEQVEEKISEKPNSRTNQLHGHNENDSTPEEKDVPESYVVQPSVAPEQTSEPTLAESLKQSLEERDKDEPSKIDQ